MDERERSYRRVVAEATRIVVAEHARALADKLKAEAIARHGPDMAGHIRRILRFR